MLLPQTCSTLGFRKPVTSGWQRFWRERNPGEINTLSSCPWVYKFDAQLSSCGPPVRAELHEVIKNTDGNHCLDLDQSDFNTRIHSGGTCQELRSRCGCNKIIGYTCVYQLDKPAHKRNSDDKDTDKDQDNGSGDSQNETELTTVITTEGDKNNDTKLEKETENTEAASSVTTINPDKAGSDKTKKPISESVVPPFLQDNVQGGIPQFLRGNHYQMGPPQYLRGLNPQLGIPPLIRPSQFNEIDVRDGEVDSEYVDD